MKKYILILSAALCLTSCNSYLDMTPTDRVSAKTMWENTANAEYAVNYLWTYIWDLNSSPTVIGLTESLTDEMKYTSYNYNALCYIPSEASYGGQILTAGYVDSYFGQWGTLYEAIRKTNEGLNYLKAYGQMSPEDKVRLEGELRFLRGYFYFELAKRYKDVILYDEDLSAISKDKAVTEESKIWDFICADFESAGSSLPNQANARGRIDCGMAWGMNSRAMLYARRYDKVIEAAEKVEALGYRLEEEYEDSYSKPLSEGNVEAILQYSFDYASGLTHSFNFYYTPGGDYSILGQKGGAYGVPTQEMVESYEYAGKYWTNARQYPDWSAWHGDGIIGEPEYAKLEPRFHATILYNGSSWKGRKIEPFVGGTDGWAVWKTEKEPKGKTVTGYYLRKLVDEDYDVNVSAGSQPFTFLRYGEVLLNKAEALYRTPSRQGEAINAVNAIRKRVGLPELNCTGDAVWNAIRHERKVELAYEGLRYWDLRRWEDATKDYPEGLNNYKLHGMKIEQAASGYKYSYVEIDDNTRTFVPKMYRFPMPESELSSNSLVQQYSEWQ